VESYRTEEEQVEALKRWWKENGRSTLLGIALALGAGFGWRFYQDNQQQNAQNASLQFQQMLQALAAAETVGEGPAEEMARSIAATYAGSTYAKFAALHLARLAVEEGDLAAAEASLRDVLSDSRPGDELHQLATLRLARVLAAQGKDEAALEILQSADGGFVASFAIARGDILLAAGRENEALVAYESAAATLDPAAPMPRTLQDKIAYLSARQPATANEAG
jgi:predicted negative regulator of RcsB-dependent stress response